MNPEGDVRQSRMQEERLENEPAQAQRNFQRNQRLSFSGRPRRIVVGRGRIYSVGDRGARGASGWEAEIFFF